MTGIERHWTEIAAEELERKRVEAVRVLRAHLLYDWFLTETDRALLAEMHIVG